MPELFQHVSETRCIAKVGPVDDRHTERAELTGHLKNMYDRGMAAGWSEDDFIGLIRLMDK